MALSFLPLVVHELTSDFSEVGAALDYLRAGGDATAIGPIGRFLVIAVRVVVVAAERVADRCPDRRPDRDGRGHRDRRVVRRLGRTRERQAARWLGFGLLWTAGFLTFASPSLSTIVPGLPNDHYHAFADPMVFTLVGMGAAVLWRGGSRGAAGGIAERRGARRLGRPPDRRHAIEPSVVAGRVVAVVGVVALVAFGLANLPPAVHPDGGFPGADRAAARIVAAGGDS